MLNFKVLKYMLLGVLLTLIGMGARAESEYVAGVQQSIAIQSTSGASHSLFPASNVLDGNLATRFASGSNPDDLFLDLGSIWRVEDLQIAWGLGHNRTYEFEIATRTNEDEAWSTVFEGDSSGATLEFEAYDVRDTEAQFIRIRGLSNSRGISWTFITKVDVLGRKYTGQEIAIQSASGDSHTLFPAANVLDGNLATRFASGSNPDDLFLDLGSVWNIEELNIAWGLGHNRTYEFEIATRANENEAWSTVFQGNSSGATLAFEIYDVMDTEAQYVRIRGLSNSRGVSWTFITKVQAFGRSLTEGEEENISNLTHFGQPITLVGANIPWSEDSGFSSDFGWYTPTNVDAYRTLFDKIQEAEGNSARIWLHTTAQVTPAINPNGVVTGLSNIASDQVVTDQLRSVLDEAWERGIVVTFSLFSFDMFCDSYGDDFGYTQVGDIERHRLMVEDNYESYIDKALKPIVSALKDHPGLFAYEVFNEPEGAIRDMTAAGHFCPDEPNVPGDGMTFPLSLSGAQKFVNHVAAAVHETDPNAKVTTSTHTNFFEAFSNQTLLSQSGADQNGTLDFYELHFYAGFEKPPYTTPASAYNLDRPIIIGEYDLEDVQQESLFQVEPENSMTEIIKNGYVGAWPWSILADDLGEIQDAISKVPALYKTLDRNAVEACIQSQDSACYKQ